MPTYRLRIDRWQPTPLNKLMRGTIHSRIKFERIDRNMICGYCLLNRVPRANGRREVSIHVTLPPKGREADCDALWKSTLDALVHAGMLIDDHRKWCRMGEVTYDRGEELSTLIELTDL